MAKRKKRKVRVRRSSPPLKEYYFEVAVSVSDLFDKYIADAVGEDGLSREDAEKEVSELVFEEVQEDTEKAMENATEEITEALNLKEYPERIKIHEVEFVEFDSSSPTHASGYFQVKMKGPKSLIDRFQAYYERQ